MIRLIHWVTSLLAIVSILASMVFIGGLVWYAIYGNPAADIGHFVKEIRQAAK